MKISENITKLLFEQDCVIIPGFGGFVANYKPAQVDYDRNIFAPPSKEISFNVQLAHNDGLLVSEVSRTSGLGYPGARKNVDNFARELTRKLEKGKKVVLEDLGSFYMDKEQHIQFDPDRSHNFLMDSFGLSVFEFEQLEEFDVRKKFEKKLEARKGIQKPVRKKALRRVLITVPLLVALVLVPIKTGLIHINVDHLSLNPFNKTEVSDPVSKTVQEANSKTIAVQPVQESEEMKAKNETKEPSRVITGKVENQDPQASKLTATQPIASRVAPLQTDMKYFVIAGSFKSRENAEQLQNFLIQEGYLSSVNNARNGFFRVSLQGYSSYTEAHKALLSFGEKHPGEKYWILQK